MAYEGVPVVPSNAPDQRQTALSPSSRWRDGQPINLISQSTSVAAGSGMDTSLGGAGLGSYVRAISQQIPFGSNIRINAIATNLVSGPIAQLFYTLNIGGPVSGYTFQNASGLYTLGLIPVNQIFQAGGVIAMDLYNISGTTFPGAAGAIAVTVIVTIVGTILHLDDRSRALYGNRAT